MKCIPFLAILFVCIACNTAKKASFSPAKKYTPGQLRQDFSLLQRILKVNHPSLYWYASSDSVNGYFNAIASSLKDSLTEQQFRNKVSWALNKIHCGHTTVRSSKNYTRFLSRRRVAQFPLLLKVWDDSAVVVGNLQPNDSILKRGTIITAINQFSTKQIIDSICKFIGTDGYSNVFRYQVISFNFPAYYRNFFGTDSTYAVKYVDSTGIEKETVVKNFEAKADTLLKRQGPLPEGVQKKQFKKLKLLNDRSLQVDTALNTAFLSVNTFSEGKLSRFFRRSFKKIHQQHVKNLVLDLRLNSGGNVLSCVRLSQYLAQKPFHVADTVAAFTRDFPYKKQIKPWFIYWLSMHISGRRYSDDRIHFRYFENHYFKPKARNHFDGNVFVMTGGYTFSAATLVTGNLKGQQNVTIVGEETGGGAYGNSAMFLTTIVLPNTGVRVTLPLYRMVLNASLPKNGRGVFPDVEVKPSSALIRKGIDPKLEKVKELIKQKNGVHMALLAR